MPLLSGCALQLGFPPEPGTCGASQSSRGNQAFLSAHLPSVALVSKCQTLGSWGQNQVRRFPEIPEELVE